MSRLTTRRAIVATVLFTTICSTAESLRASTITYDFKGTFAIPANGVSQVSGSLTYSTDLVQFNQLGTPSGYTDKDYRGPDLSITLKIGDHTISSDNWMSDSVEVGSINGVADIAKLTMYFNLKSGDIIEFGFSPKQPTPDNALPSSLDPSQFSILPYINYTGQYNPMNTPLGSSYIKIDSFQAEPVPEPSTLAVLAIGFPTLLVVTAHRGQRRRREAGA